MAPPAPGQPSVWLVRHGETLWSRDGRHTSHTDIDLTPLGEEQAGSLGAVAARVRPDLVLCSPRLRARRTAEAAGLVPYEVTPDLQEWDYGNFEGRTTSEIRATLPGWSIWNGPWQEGETAADVTARADALIARVRSCGASRVVLVGHGHFSRVLGSRWVGQPAASGRWLELGTAACSELGWSHGEAVIRRWNLPAAAAAAS